MRPDDIGSSTGCSNIAAHLYLYVNQGIEQASSSPWGMRAWEHMQNTTSGQK